ncbi:MAG: hypothetical protein N838_26680 [Thiohalocapsa sp. PB-PSB1]|jgi:hypothetical protein|nr:MAG: hypothetical protein N838_26680 [Thiohalocapsa sp. PB-PSB1]
MRGLDNAKAARKRRSHGGSLPAFIVLQDQKFSLATEACGSYSRTLGYLAHPNVLY